MESSKFSTFSLSTLISVEITCFKSATRSCAAGQRVRPTICKRDETAKLTDEKTIRHRATVLAIPLQCNPTRKHCFSECAVNAVNHCLGNFSVQQSQGTVPHQFHIPTQHHANAHRRTNGNRFLPISSRLFRTGDRILAIATSDTTRPVSVQTLGAKTP
jgi:hypothetical protein